MKVKKLRYLVQKMIDRKMHNSNDVMNTHVESLIEVIAPMIEDKIDIERQKRKEQKNVNR